MLSMSKIVLSHLCGQLIKFRMQNILENQKTKLKFKIYANYYKNVLKNVSLKVNKIIFPTFMSNLII